MFAIKIVLNRLKYAVGVLETEFANHLFLIECLMTQVKSKLAAAPELESSQYLSREIISSCAMPFSSTKDTEFGDCYFDISKIDKRLIRATVKTYERTGTYVFLKLFKKAETNYEFQQRVSLTVQEFENLIEKSADIRSQFTEEESTKPPPAKKPRFQQKPEEISNTDISNKNG